MIRTRILYYLVRVEGAPTRDQWQIIADAGNGLESVCIDNRDVARKGYSSEKLAAEALSTIVTSLDEIHPTVYRIRDGEPLRVDRKTHAIVRQALA